MAAMRWSRIVLRTVVLFISKLEAALVVVELAKQLLMAAQAVVAAERLGLPVVMGTQTAALADRILVLVPAAQPAA